MPVSGPSPIPPPPALYKVLLPSSIPPSLLALFSTSQPSAAPYPYLAHSVLLPQTPLDQNDAFIHLSTASQLPFVLNKFYSSSAEPEEERVYVFMIHYSKLVEREDVRWEEAGGKGEVFAHVYGGDVRGDELVAWRVVVRGSKAEGRDRDRERWEARPQVEVRKEGEGEGEGKEGGEWDGVVERMRRDGWFG